MGEGAVTLLAGKPPKLDAADATPEERRAIIAAGLPRPPAAGAPGKGMILLDRALKAPQPPAEGIDVHPPMAFGCTVVERGTSVILSAEDSQDEMHRRLAALDDHRTKRRAAGPRLIPVPLPNAGGTRPLVIMERGRFQTTDFFDGFRTQLLAV